MMPDLIAQSTDILNEAVEAHRVTALYALFSGGHDSLTATHLASRHPLFRGVVHIDTGTGLPETRAFVEATCKREDWPLLIRKPVTTYEMLILKMGFPEEGMHGDMYRMLKGRPLRVAKQVLMQRERVNFPDIPKPVIGWVTGARMLESDRRMGHAQNFRKDGEGIWINDNYTWSALDVNGYLRAEHLPRNLVKDTMHLSGECFCGCFSRPEEKRELDLWYPAHGKKIEAWESLVRYAKSLGLSDVEESRCSWGNSERISDQQIELFPMCQYCRGRDELEAETI